MSTVVTAKPPETQNATVDFLLTHSHDVILPFSPTQVGFIPSQLGGGAPAAARISPKPTPAATADLSEAAPIKPAAPTAESTPAAFRFRRRRAELSLTAGRYAQAGGSEASVPPRGVASHQNHLKRRVGRKRQGAGPGLTPTNQMLLKK